MIFQQHMKSIYCCLQQQSEQFLKFRKSDVISLLSGAGGTSVYTKCSQSAEREQARSTSKSIVPSEEQDL